MMTFDLPAMARERHPRKRSLVVREIEPTIGVELGFLHTLNSLVGSLTRWALSNVIEIAGQEREAFHSTAFQTPVRRLGAGDVLIRDDAGRNARTILDALRREAEQRAAEAEGRISKGINRAGQQHTRQWSAAVRTSAQIDIRALLRDDDLVDFLSIRSEQFNSLIRNLSADIRHRIERETLGSIFEGRGNEEIAKKIREIDGIGRNRARLIARDQAAKLNGAMNEFRQRQAGVTHYKWKSMMDPPRAREVHMGRNGKVFAWNKAPSGGHPGTEIMCRCRGLAVLIETPEDAEEALPEAPAMRSDEANVLIRRVAGTASSDVLDWGRDAILIRHAEALRAREALDDIRSTATRTEADQLFGAVFGFGPDGQDLQVMSGLTGVRAMAANRHALIFAAIGRRLRMIEELLEHAAETAAVGAVAREIEGQ